MHPTLERRHSLSDPLLRGVVVDTPRSVGEPGGVHFGYLDHGTYGGFQALEVIGQADHYRHEGNLRWFVSRLRRYRLCPHLASITGPIDGVNKLRLDAQDAQDRIHTRYEPDDGVL